MTGSIRSVGGPANPFGQQNNQETARVPTESPASTSSVTQTDGVRDNGVGVNDGDFPSPQTSDRINHAHDLSDLRQGDGVHNGRESFNGDGSGSTLNERSPYANSINGGGGYYSNPSGSAAGSAGGTPYTSSLSGLSTSLLNMGLPAFAALPTFISLDRKSV